MTKKEMFGLLDGIVNSVDDFDVETRVALHEFITHEIMLLEKRASSSRPTVNQIANEEIKKNLLKAVADYGPVTISELQAKDENLSQYSNQKVNALMRQLIEKGSVKREVIKKKAYFSLVTEN